MIVALRNSDKILEYLLSRTVFVSDCWIWEGGSISSEYGIAYKKGLVENVLIHRLSWFLFNAALPGRVVRHSCDNRKCWNPHHLLSGTHAQNTEDMMQRGRHVKAHPGRSRVRYVVWDSRRNCWKVSINDCPRLGTKSFERGPFFTVAEAQHWAEEHGLYASSR